MKATAITCHTLVGVGRGPYPLKDGNCFSVRCEGGKEFRIVNFNVENLEWLVKHGLTWPVEVEALEGSERVAVITDGRIPDEFFDMTFCEICCPQELLPLPQRLRRERQVRQGFRIEWERCTGFDNTKRPLKRHFTGEPEPKLPEFKSMPIQFEDVRRKQS